MTGATRGAIRLELDRLGTPRRPYHKRAKVVLTAPVPLRMRPAGELYIDELLAVAASLEANVKSNGAVAHSV